MNTNEHQIGGIFTGRQIVHEEIVTLLREHFDFIGEESESESTTRFDMKGERSVWVRGNIVEGNITPSMRKFMDLNEITHY